jgi:uncharacterized protein (TIGR00290 family)
MRRLHLEGTRFAGSWSGGKDSCLALHRAVAAGGELVKLLCLVDEEARRVLGHGLPVEVVQAQAERLGCELELCPTSWHDYEPRWTAALCRQPAHGVAAVVFGDLSLARHRRWERAACAGAGLRPVWPLWHEREAALSAELLSTGTRALITCLRTDPLPRALLGRELDEEVAAEIAAAGADPLGEHGEFHTAVVDAPLFARPVRLRQGRRSLDGGFWHLEVTVEDSA